MPRIKDSSIDEVRNRVNIYDLVSLYVSLKKSGASFKGLSPFTSEKTPSFFVYPDKNFYYCFSTSQGGDIFKFVQVKEGMSFPEAVEFIANRFSITLEYEDAKGDFSKQKQSLRKQIFDLNEDACAWFFSVFSGAGEFGEYAKKYWVDERGFSLEVASELRIGFSPIDWTDFKESIAKKYSQEAILESGLFFAPKSNFVNVKNLMPRFRGRLMIPICDVQGRVIAFTARKTNLTPSDISYEEGKYVNSPETLVFKKQDMLFNFNRAKKYASEMGYFIVVEGQLDAIRMYSCGFKNTVAGQGTALGESQFSLMSRHAKKVCLMLDGDSAGQKAANRVLPMCIAADLEPTVCVLPTDDDPDSLLKTKGVEAMQNLLGSQKNAVKFIVDNFKKAYPNPTVSDKRGVLDRIYELVYNSSSNFAKDEYLRLASTELGADYKAVASDYISKSKDRAFSSQQTPSKKQKIAQNNERQVLTNAVFDILIVCLNNADIAKAVSELIDTEWLDGKTPEEKLLARLVEFKRMGEDFDISEIEDESERNIAYQILANSSYELDNVASVASSCLERIHKNYCEKKISSFEKILKDSSSSNESKREALKNVSSFRKILRDVKFIIK